MADNAYIKAALPIFAPISQSVYINGRFDLYETTQRLLGNAKL